MKTIRLLLIAFILNIAAFASIGKISALNGDVSIIRASKTLKASAGSALEQKDVIKASKGSAAQIVFNDKTVITVGSATTFKIEEYLFDDKTPNAKFKVEEGSFKAITGKIGKIAPDKFKLETKTATIGIRGTAFVGRTDINGNLIVACTRGAIVVTPLGVFQAPPPPVIVPAGQMTNANQNGVEPPHPFTPNDLRDLNGDMNGYAKNNQGNGNNQGGNNQDNKDNKTAGVDNSVKDTVSDISSKIVDSKNNDAVSSNGDWAAAYGVDYTADVYKLMLHMSTFSGGGANAQSYDNNVSINKLASSASITLHSGGTLTSIIPDMSITGSSIKGEDDMTFSIAGTASGYPLLSTSKVYTIADSGGTDYASWGYWQADTSMASYHGTWVGGAPTSVVDFTALQSANAVYTYKGQSIGGVADGSTYDPIKLDTNNNTTLVVHFGATSYLSGTIAFNTEAGKQVTLGVSASPSTPTNFGGTIASGVTSTVNGQSITSGSTINSFYGPGAKVLGGSFLGYTTSYTVSGTYKANKQ